MRWEAGRPVFNPAFIAFITHYQCRPIACRPGHPETKTYTRPEILLIDEVGFDRLELETELNRPRSERILQGVFALIASLFGLATIVAGVRVLAGSDPGYIVFRPLLIYNAIMGMAYVAAGVIAWRSFDRGKYAAATVFVLNFLVLGAIGYLYATGSAVAIESLRAMLLRTVVWLFLFLGLAWMSHRRRGHDER